MTPEEIRKEAEKLIIELSDCISLFEEHDNCIGNVYIGIKKADANVYEAIMSRKITKSSTPSQP